MFEVNVQGMTEFEASLKMLQMALPPNKVEVILIKGASIFADAARAKAPKSKRRKNKPPPGNLKRSIVAKQLRRYDANEPAPAIAAVDRKIAPHAHLVEYGHGGPAPAPPHPFWRPAIDANIETVQQLILRALENMVEEAMR